MKRVIITGGAGFLGSNLCKKLIDSCKIFCIDNLSTGCLDNIKPFLDNPNFEFINRDIINSFDIQVDEIYNLACPASPVHYQKDPIQTFKTSVFGICNLLELAKKYNAKILQTSTSEIYGDPLEHPQKEQYWGNVNSVGIRSCYDEGKRAAESIMMDYHRIFGTKIKIARIFNTYGPNMFPDDGRVVSNFIVQALKNEDITIYGDGSQTRSYCYVDDLIDGLILLMSSDDNVFYPVNLGCDKEFTIKDTAKIVLSKIATKSKIVFKDLPQDDPKKRKPDVSRAKEVLNWEAKVSFDDGLDNTIQYFKEFIK